MMDVFISLIVICISFGITSSKLISIDDIKCNLEDDTCFRESVQKAIPDFMDGIPEVGVEVLDVMMLSPIKFDLSGLKFSLRDGRVTGMRDAILEKAKWDKENKKMEVIFHLNSLMTGNYTASGRILILPITGDGELRLKLKNVVIKLTLDYIMKERAGKQHVIATKYAFEFDVLDNANFHLTNLFNGNKDLSEAMHKFLNENWKQISIEFGTPIIKACAEKIFKNVNKFFSKYPLSEISLP